LAFLWGVAALYALHTVIPFNAVVLPFERDLPVRSLTPEGWAFFTRNPREKQISAYRRVNGTWESVDIGPNGSVANLFGLDRSTHTQSVEVSALLAHVRGRDFHSCRGTPSACLEGVPPIASFASPVPHPSLCGEVGIMSREPVPWAWSHVRPSIVMPSDTLVLEVKCHNIG
jgi:antimicrobial peptide system SdpA family protein